MDQLTLLEHFIESEINLLVKLRMGNGMDEKEYENMKRSFSLLIEQWSDKDSIPQDAVQSVMEVCGELYNFSRNYSGEESERIRDAAANISTLRQKGLACDQISDKAKEKVMSSLMEQMEKGGGFFEKLQQGKGLDEEQFEEILEELTTIDDKIFFWDTMPKPLVRILISLYEMDLFVYKYEDEFQDQVEADKIYDAYERFFDLIVG
ncbi:hypothetical protein [Gracilibacillus dipsosauri]|uniref:Uncharacterized protein n=1 Tax=Gracilibacillus dipsosauri TaxID=178340 RepID=A0A317L3W9_9BACI|nr:hypothetical protein [Gracilibacillus dipsosauri]PWU70365.1 hypothetical protein DLJ74_00560 [Gracilibacillus dipsosauri]